VKHFLLFYNRNIGKLERHLEFARGADAFKAYQRAEEQAPADVEVVLLSATSLDALRHSHANYFTDPDASLPELDWKAS
jgi:hypothetical protein